MESAGRQWVILKFGGTSVSGKSRWEAICQILSKRIEEGLKPLLVCSAISGVSDLLGQLVKNSSGDSFGPVLDQIRKKHQDLIEELGLESGLDLILKDLDQLERMATGISLIGYADSRTTARVMAMGELMLTKIGDAYLRKRGLNGSWLDARSLLKVGPQQSVSQDMKYLSSHCQFDPDEKKSQELLKTSDDFLVTQGFIAENSAGETVLLGRGGSDTSASCLGSILGASRVEIWTDVPGMFSSNPREVPSARLLLKLDYDEAQELATSGAKVLHPRCIDPVKTYDIPLYICWTERPDFQGMRIGSPDSSSSPGAKAIISKKDIHMITMDTLGMWHQVGFLAKVFDCFRKHGLSIDLVTTSQSNVTVTLDSISNIIDSGAISRLMEDLSDFCRPRSLGPLASVSLVGKNIRSMIHKLGPFLEAFEEKKIYLISQAASDLNFTIIIDESEAPRMVQKLHALFFSEQNDNEVFGPTWNELFTPSNKASPAPSPAWWIQKQSKLIDIGSKQTPVYVYDEEELMKGIGQLKSLSGIDKVHYAMKANAHPEILKLIDREGFGFDCVSLEEINYLRDVLPQFDPQKIVFTPNFAPISEYEAALKLGCTLTLDNIYPLENHPDIFRGASIMLRIDPEVGRGHHKHVRTAGPSAKFGIALSELDRIDELISQSGAKIIGLHAHVGSGIKNPETWAENALFLSETASRFKDVRVLNLGGGLGVAEKPGDQILDLEQVKASLDKIKKAFPQFQLWLEPGRYLAAQSGVLLGKVTQLKSKGQKNFVGLDVGMNSLIRPSLYGSFHEIVNLSKQGQEKSVKADVVGPICETGDVLGHGRQLPPSEEGDIFLIATAGAYGKVMASAYNLREPASEVFLKAEL